MQDSAGTQAATGGWLIRFWPVAVLLAAGVATYGFGLHRYLSFAALAEYHQVLMGLVADRPALATLAYLGVYTGAIALALPIGPVLTITGGLLFGIWMGTGLAALAATVGACVLFLVVRTAIAPTLARRTGGIMGRLRTGLERDGFWYLLSLRLLPIVPYWAGTMAPAVVGMRLRPFLIATSLGILPGTAVFASLGTGVGKILAQGGRPEAPSLMTPAIMLPLIALAALSLFTAWWRRRRHA